MFNIKKHITRKAIKKISSENIFSKQPISILSLVLSAVAAVGIHDLAHADAVGSIYLNTPASEPDQIPLGTPAFMKVFDAESLTLKAVASVLEKPHHIYKIPYQNKAYIAHFGPTASVQVVDLETNLITKNIATGTGPRHMTFAADGKSVWTANLDGNSVSHIDTTTDTLLWTSPTGLKPNYVELAGGYAFVANLGQSSLTVLNASTGAFVKDVPVGNFPFNMTVTCDGSTVISANTGTNDVSFVDVATLQETARVSIMGPVSISQYSTTTKQRLNPRILQDCKYVWVGNQAAGVFAVVNIAQRQLVAEVPSAGAGGGSDIVFYIHGGPANGLVIGTNRYSAFTTIINPNPPFNILKRIPAGNGTHYVTFDEYYKKAYVSSRLAGTFSVYDMETLTEESRVTTDIPGLDQAYYVWKEDGKFYYHPESGGEK